MRITQSKLKKIIDKVLPITRPTHLLVTENIFFKLEDDKLTAKATDLETSIKVVDDVEGKDIEFAVDAKMLSSTINALPEQPLDLSVTETHLIIVSSNGEYKIPLEDTEFPDIDFEVGDGTTIPNKEFVQAIERVIPFALNDDLRPNMSGVNFTFGNNLKIAATNAHILSEQVIDVKGEGTFIIQIKALKTLLKEQNDFYICEKGNSVLFETGDTIISTLKINGKFPTYEQLFNESWQKIEFDRVELLQSLKRISPYIGEAKKVSLEFADQLTIKGENETANAVEKLPYNGEPININFNAGFLASVLKWDCTWEALGNKSVFTNDSGRILLMGMS